MSSFKNVEANRDLISKSSEDSISSGDFFPCLSTAEFYIVCCNKRLTGKTEVGLKVWNSIADLGVESYR